MIIQVELLILEKMERNYGIYSFFFCFHLNNTPIYLFSFN